MNPDYTSDIRLVERFIFEHSLYLLHMFDKKIHSFSNSGPRNNNCNPLLIQPIPATHFPPST